MGPRLALRRSVPFKIWTKKPRTTPVIESHPWFVHVKGSSRSVAETRASANSTYRANGLAAPGFTVGGGTGAEILAAGLAGVLPAEPAAAFGVEVPPGLAEVWPGGLCTTGFDISVPGTKL